MDIWDRNSLKKITTVEAPNSSECSWSPDGRYIMTATLSPRLRVDNGYKIWHYTGALVHSQNIQELLQVQWRPASVELYPMRQLSPAPENAKSPTSPTKPSSGAYLPPQARARGTPTVDIFKREEETNNKVQENGAKPAGTPEIMSKAAVKNKKKREAKKRREEETVKETVDSSDDIDTLIVSPSQTSPVKNEITNNGIPEVVNSIDMAKSDSTQQSTSNLSETDKKIRNLTKKLRQIAELKDRQMNGDKLEITQSKQGILLKDLHGIWHPSQPNYISMICASKNGMLTDFSQNLNGPSLPELLEEKNISWKAYIENYPGNGFKADESDDKLYVRKHNPFISMNNIRKDSTMVSKIVNSKQLTDDIEKDDVPQYVFYVPNINNNGEKTNLKFASNFLKNEFIPLVQHLLTSTRTLLVITFDEAFTYIDFNLTNYNHIYTTLIGPNVLNSFTHNDDTRYSHFSWVPTIEVNWNLSSLGNGVDTDR
ncbi:4045_t:CDS:2 [Funneliformis caledonium]|uniref:4045_t:CDS:1 n=1 Tax=Funneliformis caledonium TaxID=1117310 RepID=A0A9N9HCE6_9GLOM|nr:4045_t:CDS:2 [Funneliformis caledonium]